jgi:hypothetical protein
MEMRLTFFHPIAVGRLDEKPVAKHAPAAGFVPRNAGNHAPLRPHLD